jgi:hypothetical protein
VQQRKSADNVVSQFLNLAAMVGPLGCQKVHERLAGPGVVCHSLYPE